MVEVININTKESMGVFGTVAAAENWIATHGGADQYRIFPW